MPKKELEEKQSAIELLTLTNVQLAYRLAQARATLCWRLFGVVRFLRDVWFRITGQQRLDLVPLQQLQQTPVGWESTGNDPQFLLFAERAWHGLSGWYQLELSNAADHTLPAQLFVDTGSGFSEALSLTFELDGSARQSIPFFVPPTCRHIRLDPCASAVRFKLKAPLLSRLKVPPSFEGLYREQQLFFQSLGWCDGLTTCLKPLHNVEPAGVDFVWRATGTDPQLLLVGQQLSRGCWYRCICTICSTMPSANAKLYFDVGNGFEEANSLLLPFESGATIERLVYCPDPVNRVRFDPFELPCRFTIEHLSITQITESQAEQTMVQRVAICSPDYAGNSVEQVREACKLAATEQKQPYLHLLVSWYDATFVPFSAGALQYQQWIELHEKPLFEDVDALLNQQQSFVYQPLVSIVMPVYNTDERLLRSAIDSVVRQCYPHWELCIADDASTQPQVRRVLDAYAAQDKRIKIVYRTANGHISQASNSALKLATGDYIALLDHDDELALYALHCVAGALNSNRKLKIIYSDEDKLSELGERIEPHFKPDWSPDQLFSQNYVSHLGVYRRDLIKQIRGFRQGVEGSQDYDLLLRCLPFVKPDEIGHIPHVLYHWRVVKGSTAQSADEKGYTTQAGIMALQDYFGAQGMNNVVVEQGLVPNTYRVRYPVPELQPLVSLLIPTRDMLTVLKPCIESILTKTTYRNYEIIILDNESREPATLNYFAELQRREKRVKVVAYHQPFNYSAINNFGVTQAKGQLVGLVNNDIEVISPDWLTEMVSHTLRPEIGCVGAKLYYDDNTIQHAGVITGLGGVAGHSHKYFPRNASGYFHRLKIVQNLSAVTAACLVVRKEVYQEVGGLNERDLKVAFNDVDFCLRVRTVGYRNLWTPYAELYHHESKSRGAEDTPEKMERFKQEVAYMQETWGEQLYCDPYYSANLTLDREDFSF